MGFCKPLFRRRALEKERADKLLFHSEYENEFCILCGTETNVKKSTPISLRKGYAEGCGQFCERCYCTFYARK